ncbi:MAG TPA: aminoglycoside phosphotransferase family protein [Chloroflexota bacterium]|nr:aminoglycoside phosphotransferase family protein [Chloroflexota bacterium]
MPDEATGTQPRHSAKSLRRPPSAATLARLTSIVAPGGRVETIRRLRGGISSGMHAIDLVEQSGDRRRLIVRRYSDYQIRRDPDLCDREWQTLTMLGRAELPIPEPVWRDPTGLVFGVPALVMTRLPGQGLMAPRDPVDWARQLATTLAAIHRAPIAERDLTFLARKEAELVEVFAKEPPAKDIAGHPDGAAIWAALRHWWPRLERTAPTIIHDDYWPGNTVWLRGRLTGVVDWEDTRWGDPGNDVGYCRSDISMLYGPSLSDVFLDAYESAAGREVSQVFFWDLLGTTGALLELERWLPGYHELGRTDITLDLMSSRLRAFIAGALARAGG